MKRILIIAAAMSAIAAPSAHAGQWAVECGWSHQGQYDSIRAPGSPGASHLHEFFGLRGVTDTLTPGDLQRSLKDPGNNTCLLKGDGSAYWAPALYQDGERIQPSSAYAYYVIPKGKVEAYPMGLEILGGDVDTKKPQSGIISWYCDWDSTNSGPPQDPPPCGSVEPRGNPDGSTLRDQLRLSVSFPSCWNGQRELGAVVYPRNGQCPRGHQKKLPQLQLNVMYPVRYPGSGISLASGSIISAHADFVNGWDPQLQAQLIKRCQNRDCGRLRDRNPEQAFKPSKPIVAEQVRQLLQSGL